ncbi:hypothetical protein [Methylocucumis oryzae]|uniref:hypothetical protein n=1 Tax=Methylocucumis oryzae TaxID=1632867 RepID=UPI00069874D0|nr:hypothetical protein [Methylocucumis oryzae]
MPKLLPKITYSLADRGRTVTGVPRDKINIKAIVDDMNSQTCQEKVASRDMHGYLGHWPRVRFNSLLPITGGLADGKVHYLQPALVTTYLKAFPDGTVEHQSELLDTDPGIAAQKMWDSKVGGFSSAIDFKANRFYGFDYVPDPNFIKNSYRGVMMLDSASSMTEDELDFEISNEIAQGLMQVINQRDFLLDQANAALNNAIAENEELLSILATRGMQQNSYHFDDGGGNQQPISVALDSTQRVLEMIDSFRLQELPVIRTPLDKEQQQVEEEYQSIVKVWGGR